MAITFTRTYDRAEVAKSQDGLSDVVLSIYCNVTATEDAYSAVAGTTIDLSPPEANQFVPFDQITQELVDSWVTPKEQYIKLEETLTKMIEDQKNPPVVTMPLPFNSGN